MVASSTIRWETLMITNQGVLEFNINRKTDSEPENEEQNQNKNTSLKRNRRQIFLQYLGFSLENIKERGIPFVLI